MNNVESRVLEMKFDNEQFESAVSTTMSTLDKFKEKLKFEGSSKGLENLGKATSNYQYTLQDIGESVSNLERRFSTLGTVGARVLERLTDSAFGFVKSGIDRFVGDIVQGGQSRAMNLEQAQFQLRGILGSAEEVHRVIYGDILPQLQGTPFSLDQAAVVMGQLAASGKTTSFQIQRATRGIAGLAAMTNHSFADVGRIFTKVAGSGVMMAEELNQLSGYGVNAASDLSKFFKMVQKDSSLATPAVIEDMAKIEEAFGEFNEANIREAASKRMLSYGSMAAAMDVLYGEHAQKSTQLYTGALEDLKAALARIGAEPATIRLNFLRDAFNALVPAVDAVNAVIKPLWNASRSSDKAFKNVEEYVKPFTGPIAQKVQKLGWEFQKLFVQLDKNNEIIRVTKKNYKKLGLTFDKETKVFKDLKSNLEYDEKQALMNPKMLKTITASTKGVVNIVSALAKVLKSVSDGMRAIFPKVTLDNIANIAEKFESFTEKLILSQKELDRLQWFSQGLFTPLNLAIRGLVGTVGLLVKAFGFLSNILSPVASVLNSIFGFIGKFTTGIGNLIRNVISTISGNITKATEKFRNSKRWVDIFESIASVCSKIATAIDQAGDKVYDFLTNLHEIPAVQTSLSTVGNAIDIIKKGIDFLTDAVSKLFDKLGLGEKFTKLSEKLMNFFSSESDDAADSLEGFGGKFKNFGLYTSLVSALSGSFAGLVGVIGKLSDYKPLKGFRKWLSDLGGIILDLGRSFVDGDFFVDRAKEIFGWFGKYRTWGGRVKNGFLPAIESLAGSIPKLLNFKDWGSMMGAASKKLGSFFNFLTKTLGLFGTGVAQDAKKGVENLSEITAGIRKSASNLGDNQYLAPLKTFFEKFGESFKKWTKDMDPQTAKRLIISLAYFGTCLYYLSTINTAAKAFRGLATVANAVTKGLSALGAIANAFTGIGTALQGAVRGLKMVVYMHAVAVALIGLAASMYIISLIDPNRLAASAVITVGALVVIVGLLFAVDKIAGRLGENTSKTMLMVAAVIGALAGAVLAIAGSLKIISTIKEGELGKAVGSVISIIAVFGVVMGSMSLLPKLSDKGGAFNNISTSAWALVGIAAGIRQMAEALRLLADLYENGDEEALDKAVGLVNELIILTGVFGLLGGWAKHSFATGMSIIPLALGMKIIVGSIMDLATSLDEGEMNQAMKAFKCLESFISHLAVLFLALGALSVLSGMISKNSFLFTGKSQMGSAMVIIAEVIAGVWVVAQAMMKLGTLTTEQIDNGIAVLKAFGILVGVIAAIAYFGGSKMAGGVGAVAGLAVGLYLLAEGIVALGETERYAAGLARLGGVLLGLVVSLVLVTAAVNKFASSFLNWKDAAAIALLSAAMLGFALSIRMLAECPWQSLLVAIGGLVGVMLAAALVMSAFAAAGPALLPVAGVFALLGVAALGLGAGIFLLTMALTALIPLIIGVGQIPLDQVAAGIAVLKEAATGLSEVFGIMAGGILKAAGALIVLGVGLLVVGAGGVVLAVGILAVSAAVFLFAGSLIVLYEVLSAFFPSVVQPVESGMAELVNTFTRGLLDPTVNTVGETGDAVNQKIAEKGDEGAAIAEEKSQTIAEKMNFADILKENGFEGDIDEIAAMTGMAPEEMSAAWSENSGLFTGAVDGTMSETDFLMSQFGENGYEYGYDGMASMASGAMDGSSLPMVAEDSVLGKLMAAKEKQEAAQQRSGEAQMQKLYAGMQSKESLIDGEAKTIGKKAVPPSQYNESKEVGIGVGSGIMAGVQSMMTDVYNASYKLGAASAQGAKDGADVNSPSKKTIPVGSAIGEGLIVGMRKISKSVVTASEDLASGSVSALSLAMQKSAAAFDSDMDFTPTITPVVDLTNVDQSVSQMGSMFGTAFGINSPFGSMNAALAAASFNDSRNQNARMKSIDNLASKLDSMTETMNSRSLNNYITVDGASDPEAFADALASRFRLHTRTL